MAKEAKPLVFRGDSRDILSGFSIDVRTDAGRALWQVQNGKEPADWKPMKTVGAGVNELRMKDEAGIYRVFYIAKLADAVYVLHCFQKKTQQTDQRDIDIGKRRLKELLEEKRR
jgi:phage-related protein